jgi:hypothetical protein
MWTCTFSTGYFFVENDQFEGRASLGRITGEGNYDGHGHGTCGRYITLYCFPFCNQIVSLFLVTYFTFFYVSAFLLNSIAGTVGVEVWGFAKKAGWCSQSHGADVDVLLELWPRSTKVVSQPQ